MRVVSIERIMPQRRSNVQEQVEYILSVALRGNRAIQQGWVCKNKTVNGPVQKGNFWVSRANLTFEKTKGHLGGDAEFKQWDHVLDVLTKACQHAKFNKYPWKIKTENSPDQEIQDSQEKIKDVKEEKRSFDGVQDILVPEMVLSINDLRDKFPHELLNDETGDKIENHPAFKGIYGRSHIIRLILSGIWNFLESDGEVAPHTLLYGPPACAKTRLLRGIEDVFGPGAFLNLDATNTTRAGLERMVFEKLEHIPLFIKMEEIEKADEGTLAMWLGAMDERREFRKVNFHKTRVRQVKFMGFGTANDKERFDKMMNTGGKSEQAGALSSRFSQQWECPRPTPDEMKKILVREVVKVKGKNEWIDPCMELAERICTNDPRQVISFLAGRERLMSGDYQRDMLKAKNIC